MTHYRKRTASEREMIAKKLKNSSLGKRKPRRAIRRKPQNVNKGTELTVGDTEGGTGGTPNVKSAAGSVCGDSVCGGVSVIGGGSGDGGESGSARSPLVRSSVSFDQTNKQPSPRPSCSSSDQKRRKRKDTLTEWNGSGSDNVKLGGSKGGAASSSSTSCSKMKKQRIKSSAGCGASVISVTKSMSSGGKRVSGRVKSVNDKDRNRFILETEEADNKLGTTVFHMLGRRRSSEELGKEMRKLQTLQHESPRTRGVLGVPSTSIPPIQQSSDPPKNTRMISAPSGIIII
jgi:hypothetical protein